MNEDLFSVASEFVINWQEMGFSGAMQDLCNLIAWSLNAHQTVACVFDNPIVNAIANFVLGSC